MGFQNYEELVDWFKDRRRRTDMASVFSYLETCVETEAQDLVEGEIKTTERQRVTRKLEDKCLLEAQEQFVEEISQVLDAPDAPPLHHWSVIGYRRKPKVWAIASAMRERINAEAVE